MGIGVICGCERIISGFCRRNFNSEIKITNQGTIPGRTLELYTTEEAASRLIDHRRNHVQEETD